MNWIKSHKLLTALIAILLVLCIIMGASYANNGKASPIGRAVEKGTSTVLEPAADAEAGLAATLKGIFRFNAVIKENEDLKDEIIQLKTEIIQISLTKKELSDLQELSTVLNYKSVSEGRKIVTGNVIGMDGSNWFNIFTIDIGTESGVHVDAVVANGNGLVGRVMETGNGWSKIIAIIDESSKTSFEVFRDLSLMGVLEGDGDGNLKGFMFDADAGIIEGDSLITSGIGIYPEGIEIGKVTKVDYNADTQLKTIEIEPAVSFKEIKRVTVII